MYSPAIIWTGGFVSLQESVGDVEDTEAALAQRPFIQMMGVGAKV